MAAKSARKGKVAAKETEKAAETLANFTLPTSLPCSEVEFPILMKTRYKANWKSILAESEKEMHEIEAHMARKRPGVQKSPFLIPPRYFTETESDYIRDKVFKSLLPALEETLIKAITWEVLSKQRSFFNGIDHIVQVLWNNNPRHPNRNAQHPDLHVFNMPWVRAWLKDNPRPTYPKSWLWPEDYAATIIQKSVRQFFVQRDEQVQEMREFWRKLEVEKDIKDEILENPFLAKRFASQSSVREMQEHK